MESRILDNKIGVNVETLIKEAIKKLESDTGTKIQFDSLKDNTVFLIIDGNDNSVSVLKDRLRLEGESAITEDLAVNKIKRALAETLDTKWKGLYELNLKSMDSNTGDMVHISLEINLDTIPYPIRVSYHIAEDGYVTMGYSVFGDVEKDERWSSSSITNPLLLDKLAEIERYYSVRHIEA